MYANCEFIVPRGGKHTGFGPDIDLTFLEGKKITKIGRIDVNNLPYPNEANFAIDYIDDNIDNNVEMRVVIGANDLGMWIEWHGKKGVDNPTDILLKKIMDAEETVGSGENIKFDKYSDGSLVFYNEYGTLNISSFEVSLLDIDFDENLSGEEAWAKLLLWYPKYK